jgi:hypothetical protein
MNHPFGKVTAEEIGEKREEDESDDQRGTDAKHKDNVEGHKETNGQIHKWEKKW